MAAEKIWSYEFEKQKGLSGGQLLLSEPFMFDDNFRRTVVLICSHDEENGTVGLVLNKLTGLQLNDVLDDFPTLKAPVFLGGPVGADTVQFIHSIGDEIEGSIQLSEHLYWGGNFEQLRSLIASGRATADNVHFYLGYSGWSPGQLLQEMQESTWIVANATSNYIFRSDMNGLWKEVMKNMGAIYAVMADYPENPILN